MVVGLDLGAFARRHGQLAQRMHAASQYPFAGAELESSLARVPTCTSRADK